MDRLPPPGPADKDHHPATPLPANEVHVWWTDGNDEDVRCRLAAYRDLLTDEEDRRYQRFRHAGAQRDYLLARALVRCVLSRYCPVAPADWRFCVTPAGRPLVAAPDRPAPDFSLSHADGRVICAVAWGAVGIDTEPCDRGHQVLGLSDSVFSAEERAELCRLPPAGQADRAIALWTAKEAFLKALGTGLATPLTAVTVALRDGALILRDPLPPLAGSAADWDLKSWTLAGQQMTAAIQHGGRFRPLIRLARMVPLGA
jgi:4'-phosphopantetheinyl transferase